MDILIGSWYGDEMKDAIKFSIEAGNHDYLYSYSLGEDSNGAQVYAFSKQELDEKTIHELEDVVSNSNDWDEELKGLTTINNIEYNFIR